MDISKLVDVFGSRVASGAMPDPVPAGYCSINYAEICSTYTCTGLYECYVFDCTSDYDCSSSFSCPNMGNYDDFTCSGSYTVSGNCSSPPTSIPCY